MESKVAEKSYIDLIPSALAVKVLLWRLSRGLMAKQHGKSCRQTLLRVWR